jgi:AraC-like DNA-binding protein
MNEFDIIGKTINPGYCLPIRVLYDHEFAPVCAEGRFAFLHLAKGSALIRIGERTLSVIAPCCFCLNETETAELVSSDGCCITRVFFHPSAMNSKLSFENIRGGNADLTLTEQQDRSFLKPFLVRDNTYHGYLPLGPMMNDRVAAHIRNLKDETEEQHDRFWPCRSRSFFLELIYLLFKLGEEPRDGIISETDDSLAGRIIHFINCNYDSKITLDDLGRRFVSNRTTINEAVSARTGMTVIQYLNRTRISASCILLRDTKLPVLEILYRTGFNDLAHFGRMFRRFAGTTPGDYRKSCSMFLKNKS